MSPIEETVKAMIAWGWTVELDSTRAVSKAQIKRKVTKLALVTGQVHLTFMLSVVISSKLFNLPLGFSHKVLSVCHL